METNGKHTPDTLATYECTPGIGSGRLGSVQSGIRHEARKLGLTLDPFPFAKLSQPVTPLRTRVTGPLPSVLKFESYMRMMGYEDRQGSQVVQS